MKIVVANWKANPATLEEAAALATRSDFEGVVLCPPFVFLEEVRGRVSRAALGAQDLFWEGGAHTGEVSSEELARLGVRFVIVGHSERRAMGDTNEIVGKKLAAAAERGLTPILCVGEPSDVRHQGGESAAFAFVEDQLRSALRGASDAFEKLIVAYEPIWAIGSGFPETRAGAEKMAASIRRLLPAARVLYGGSVTGANADEFLGSSLIAGVLVGGASLDADEFGRIVRQSERFSEEADGRAP